MAETNALLKSIGAGINLNVSDVVEKQIKDMLARYRAEVRKASEEADKSGQDMANSMRSAESQIKSLLTTTQKLNADGSITETRNPWASFFKKAKLDDALKEAKRDMAALDVSSLWDLLLW